MSDGEQGSASMEMENRSVRVMSEAQIALILARAALDDAAASNDGDPQSGQWIDAANASIESASEAWQRRPGRDDGRSRHRLRCERLSTNC